MTSLSPILGKWTKLGNKGTTCWTDTKIDIWNIWKVRNPKMKAICDNFQNFNTCRDVIIPNFREMDQIRKQQNRTTCRTDTKIGIWNILMVRNPKLKACYDVIISKIGQKGLKVTNSNSIVLLGQNLKGRSFRAHFSF